MGRAAGTRGGRRQALAAVALVVGAFGVVVACDSSGSGGSAASSSAFSPNPSGFSGSPPSALSSLASSAKSEVSSAAASLSAAASSFAASASAEASRGRAAAESALATAAGRGNVTSGVTITGVPKASSGGLNAAVVTVVNTTSSQASYAVRVNFSDPSGNVVDTSVLSFENVAPGATAKETAFSTKSPDQTLVPTVAQAERY
ncbi:hypothetical protein AB0D08_07645 [Kitasatospora sp. NPDC048540]|uniref:hypothetical protein n=1 Tax=unclassified Kitasatospora TaxID=2633591 RepID=UPI000539E55A|nr:hypothetical protein [Kitasatospora sp. MBT63]